MKILYDVEDILIANLITICIIISSICDALYGIKIINNIKTIMPDIITFASIIVVIMSMVLMLLISLKESDLFKRLKKFFPIIEDEIYKFTARVIYSSIGVVIMAIIILVMPSNINIWIKYILGLIGLILFWYMTIGSIYLMKFTADMVVRGNDMPKREKIE